MACRLASEAGLTRYLHRAPQPNRRLQPTGRFSSEERQLVCMRAGRPQLMRGPLGGHAKGLTAMYNSRLGEEGEMNHAAVPITL